MDLTAMYASSYLVIDNLITVDLLIRTDGVYAAPQSVQNVLKQHDDKRDTIQNPATMDATTTTFRLWDAMLAGSVPEKGSKIVEADGTTWHVTHVERLGHKTAWRCDARKDRTP